ncbi:MAG: hypothetical protein V1738_02990 [Patescibacteria group bacterium]
MPDEMNLPNRQRFYEILQQRITSARRIQVIIKMMEPFFVNASAGRYELQPARRLNRRQVKTVIESSLRLRLDTIEFCSLTRPVPRQPWMTHQAYMDLLQNYILHCIWNSTSGLGMRTALASAYGSYLQKNQPAALSDAEDILQQCFGNTLWKSVNSSLFSGTGYVLEETLKHYLAFQLNGNGQSTDWLVPLVRLLPRAIPLGLRTDRFDIFVILVA